MPTGSVGGGWSFAEVLVIEAVLGYVVLFFWRNGVPRLDFARGWAEGTYPRQRQEDLDGHNPFEEDDEPRIEILSGGGGANRRARVVGALARR